MLIRHLMTMFDPHTKAIARTILNGFERHIYLFSQITKSAQTRFEQGQWLAIQAASRDRNDYFDLRVQETLAVLRDDFRIETLDDTLWRQVKQFYIALLQTHPQAELAESFYNSVFCHLFDRRYYFNDFIFVESCLAIDRSNETIYTRYSISEKGLCHTITHIIEQAGFKRSFAHIKKDVKALIKLFIKHPVLSTFALSTIEIDILNFVFYRNKGAYIIGRVLTPAGNTPFIVPIVNNLNTGLKIDALLTDEENMAVVFGFARSYFFVDCLHPTALVNFLQTLIPHKTRADLYSAIGFHKQGKTQFYRDFLTHLNESDDQFKLADGIKGMVMSVFTLPSYPYVFKIIKDHFSPSKSVTKKEVKEKYRLVKLHDRVGRMADTMEYSQVAFPKHRFSQALIDELLNVAPSIITIDEQLIIIKHVYIERRMTPLNLYLAKANDEQIAQAMFGYGEAIKQLIAANIFPGDMLLKNFGVTRHGRVIFYDYDEITYMNEVNFRQKPMPVTEAQIYASEPWYTVEKGDVFPEEIATFALANPKYRNAFLIHHADLLTATYWQHQQQEVARGEVADVFPYPEQLKI
ncbi:bifunctional isocitrate dehydrogenase kinase/phosphatase [Thalassotalea hakodatensis]|uniref:bifunctional isocitrate dehydrogenase kinase/phosphatase n=1 Tax=Thalassotalea hakodatensis TaxID=3030492 RepID=UPI002AC31972|nr:bifunctional isocitrate dehydrogenase kinase/phosphatase [Thalassotalea hakodatensis]